MLESREEFGGARAQGRSARLQGDLASALASNADSVVSTARGLQQAEQKLTEILAAIDSLWDRDGPSARGSSQRKCIPRLQQHAESLKANCAEQEAKLEKLAERLEIMLASCETYLASTRIHQREKAERTAALTDRVQGLIEILLGAQASAQKKSPVRTSPEKKARKGSPRGARQ